MLGCDTKPARAARATMWAMGALALMLATAPGTGAATLEINEFLAGPARDWNGDAVYSSAAYGLGMVSSQ